MSWLSQARAQVLPHELRLAWLIFYFEPIQAELELDFVRQKIEPSWLGLAHLPWLTVSYITPILIHSFIHRCFLISLIWVDEDENHVLYNSSCTLNLQDLLISTLLVVQIFEIYKLLPHQIRNKNKNFILIFLYVTIVHHFHKFVWKNTNWVVITGWQ